MRRLDLPRQIHAGMNGSKEHMHMDLAPALLKNFKTSFCGYTVSPEVVATRFATEREVV